MYLLSKVYGTAVSRIAVEGLVVRLRTLHLCDGSAQAYSIMRMVL